MKKYTRKDYESLLPKRKRRKRKGRQVGGVQDAFNDRSPFVQNYPVLALIGSKKVRKTLKRAIIEKLNRNELRGVMEVVNNFLKSRIPVNDIALNQLKRNRKTLYKFLQNRQNPNSQKKIISQHGGIFSALIPLAANVLSPVISKVFGSLLR